MYGLLFYAVRTALERSHIHRSGHHKEQTLTQPVTHWRHNYAGSCQLNLPKIVLTKMITVRMKRKFLLCYLKELQKVQSNYLCSFYSSVPSFSRHFSLVWYTCMSRFRCHKMHNEFAENVIYSCYYEMKLLENPSIGCCRTQMHNILL
jgi:hypothetical protein